MNTRISILVIATAVLFLAGCTKKDVKKGGKAEVPVSVVDVVSGSISDAHEYIGTAEEGSSVTLSFNTAGTIKTLSVKEGVPVKKGQLLATLDERTAQSAYNAAKAALDRAKDGYSRAEQVYRKGSMAEVKWIEIQTQLEQAQSMADISQKSLEDCRLYAPVSGVIGNISVEKGMNVLPYQPVFNIMNISQLAIKINIPENEISKIRIGQKVKVRVSSLDDAVFEGAVDERGVAADELSHSYPVKIRLSRTPKDLLPGMVCKVAFAGGDSSEGFEIPNRAVQLDNDGRRFVWVAEDGTAHRRYVTIGDLTRNGVIISSGIEENEQVITDGISKICEGSKIKIK